MTYVGSLISRRQTNKPCSPAIQAVRVGTPVDSSAERFAKALRFIT
jgi:hypothetical protein